MTDVSYANIKCCNPDVIEACALAIGQEILGGDWQHGDTELGVSYETGNSGINISEIITNISRRFPTDVITCGFSYKLVGSVEYKGSDDVYFVEYLNGEVIKKDVEPIYLFKRVHLKNEEDTEGIYNKAKTFFLRLDTKETDKDGHLFINWFAEDVTYKFTYATIDGENYSVEATKKGPQKIDFKIYDSPERQEIGKEDPWFF
jgi:hypothetical protein